METLLLVLVVVLVIGGLVFGVISLLSGDDPGLVPAEPDGRASALPNDRSLHEEDLKEVRFDIALRGYRMAQVDRMLRRTAYDLGYKDEMIAVLEAEVIALREGRLEDAELLRKAREAAASPAAGDPGAAATWTELPADRSRSQPGTVGGQVFGGQVSDVQVSDVPVSDGGPAEEGVAEEGLTEEGADERGPAEAGRDEPSALADGMPAEPAADDEPDLPREGSLRRRSITPEEAADAGTAVDLPDDTATVDAVDRPAHA